MFKVNYWLSCWDSLDSFIWQMGFQFAGKATYTAVWIAAISLFMELLGFSTQKWLTAGGLGTVLLTLAGREVHTFLSSSQIFSFWIQKWDPHVSLSQIFTNFLSSVMIHATRPFVVNEWIQTRIEGYEVSGTVEVCIYCLDGSEMDANSLVSVILATKHVVEVNIWKHDWYRSWYEISYPLGGCFLLCSM